MTNITSEISLRTRILLAIQAALLGAISANIRAVLSSWTDTRIQARVIFDDEFTDNDSDCITEVETEVMSHFPDHEIDFRCERIDAPLPIQSALDEVFVFKRKEA